MENGSHFERLVQKKYHKLVVMVTLCTKHTRSGKKETTFKGKF